MYICICVWNSLLVCFSVLKETVLFNKIEESTHKFYKMYKIDKCQIKTNKNIDIKFSVHDIQSQIIWKLNDLKVFGRKKNKRV